MSPKPEITRREFVGSAALLAAAVSSSNLAGVQALAQSATKAPPAAAHEIDMGSVFPYGAVYFRKSNPPREDWARDHATAARVGMNTFRHWFLWSAIEVAPGKFDWTDYDRMMDLAHANGLKVIIAEFTTCAPEWAFRKYAAAKYKANDGSTQGSVMGVSTVVGGFPGLCLDNPEAHAAAERFLTALVTRYRSHPALLGYDIWNENTLNGGGARKMNCYCEASKARFREWLKARYPSLAALGRQWNRYSFETWDDVEPTEAIGPYADSLDWLQFRIDDAFRLLKWRVDLVRRLDPRHLITAHGVAGTLESLPTSAHNEWRSAELMDVWGFTWIASRHGDAPWLQWQAVDLVRGGARGKPFWHAEAEGGPLWMQPQVIGHPREDGRQPDAEDVRIWNLISCAGGARGILYPRWRPLLDGPLFGAFGPFAMDGSITERAEMAGKVAKWANAHPEVWQARPVRGDLGIVFIPESEIFNFAQQGATEYYAQSIRGAYQAFFDSNIQADFVALQDIEKYRLIYLPYPVMLKQETVDRLRVYVQNGGTLISEGLPGYFGDRGHVGTRQPNFGLDKLFGAREKYVEFDPDLSDQLTLEVRGNKIYGRYFRQDYDLLSGRAVGHYANGNIAAVENAAGNGRTLLIGTFPGAGYYLHHAEPTRKLFSQCLQMAGVAQRVTVDSRTVQARLHTSDSSRILWLTNPAREPMKVSVTLTDLDPPFHSAEDLWAGAPILASGRTLTVTVPPRDAVVARLA